MDGRVPASDSYQGEDFSFILIAPDGRIINSDMSRPSDPETAKALRAYLKDPILKVLP